MTDVPGCGVTDVRGPLTVKWSRAATPAPAVPPPLEAGLRGG